MRYVLVCPDEFLWKLLPPSASFHRLRAQAHRLLGEKEKADAAQARADDPKAPATALDHFLAGMALQAEATRTAETQAETDAARQAREKKIERVSDEA